MYKKLLEVDTNFAEVDVRDSTGIYLADRSCGGLSKDSLPHSAGLLFPRIEALKLNRVIIIGGCGHLEHELVDQFLEQLSGQGVEAFWYSRNADIGNLDEGMIIRYLLLADQQAKVQSKVTKERELLAEFPRVLKIEKLVLDIGEPLSALFRVKHNFLSEVPRIALIKERKSEVKEGVLVTGTRHDRFTYVPAERPNALDASRFEDGRALVITLEGCPSATLYPEVGDWTIQPHPPISDEEMPWFSYVSIHQRLTQTNSSK